MEQFQQKKNLTSHLHQKIRKITNLHKHKENSSLFINHLFKVWVKDQNPLLLKIQNLMKRIKIVKDKKLIKSFKIKKVKNENKKKKKRRIIHIIRSRKFHLQ